MKVDITVQLIFFVINLCMCTGAVIFTRRAAKLREQALKLTSRMEDLNNSLFSLHECYARIRTLRLKKVRPMPECIKFDTIERARFLELIFKDMTGELASNMLADGLIKIESISEKKDYAGRNALVLEISAQVLPPENNPNLPS